MLTPRHRAPRNRSFGPEEVRAEYAACVSYHASIVNTRFTIAGLYIAAMAFIVGAAFKPELTWDFRTAIAVLACWLSACLWIIELRSRSLYTTLAVRGVEIERREWKLLGNDIYSGFFSRQLKLPPAPDQLENAPNKPGPDRPTLGWRPGRPIPEGISKYLSHSLGFDLLYFGGLSFWLFATAISLTNWYKLFTCHV